MTPSRPDADADGWDKDASHWLVTITNPAHPRDSLTTTYSQGSAFRRWKKATLFCDESFTQHDRQRFGYKVGGPVSQLFLSQKTVWAEGIRDKLTEPTPPELANVLNCLALDASSYDNARNFDDWASDLGYDTDSRKAEAAYRACGELAKSLRHLLGPAAYAELLACESL